MSFEVGCTYCVSINMMRHDELTTESPAIASTTMTTPLDVQTECRAHFPALKDGYIFADNAGGSQVTPRIIKEVGLNSKAERVVSFSA